jgi:signal transduction histidine kinase
MEAEVKQKVFIPFFSTKRDGDGIGLAMVERIIKAHNAEIQVRSAPNEGSTFVVRLPIW